jgi:hypothetical protein
MLHDSRVEAHMDGQRIAKQRRAAVAVLLAESIQVHHNCRKFEGERLLDLPSYELVEISSLLPNQNHEQFGVENALSQLPLNRFLELSPVP